MHLGGIVLGTVGLLLALADIWFAVRSEIVAPRPVALAALSCLVGLLGLWLATRGRPRLGALLLIEASLGLLGVFGQQVVPPVVVVLAAAALVGLAPGPVDHRLRGSRARLPLRIG